MYRTTSFLALVAILLCAAGAEAEVIHQWHLDDNMATDSVGSLDGTATNTTATTNLLGQADKAMEFNGSTTSVTFTDTLTLGNTGTLALLVRPDAILSNTTYPFQARTPAQNDRLYIDVKNENGVDNLRFNFGDKAAFDRINVTGRTSTWMYTGMTWTYDIVGGKYTVIPFCTDELGTVVMNASTLLGGNPPSGATMSFGLGPDGFSGRLRGALDEVSIYDTALTLTELQANYETLAIPEPSTAILFLMGMVSLLVLSFRK